MLLNAAWALLRASRDALMLSGRSNPGGHHGQGPMVLGGPLSHVMAAKAVALAEARQPSFQAYAQRVADNAKATPFANSTPQGKSKG